MDAEKLIESQDKLVRDLEEKVHENTFRATSETPQLSHEAPTAATIVPQEAPSPSSAIATHTTSFSDASKQPEQLTNQSVPPDKQILKSRFEEQCKALQEKVSKLEEDNARLQVFKCRLKVTFVLKHIVLLSFNFSSIS